MKSLMRFLIFFSLLTLPFLGSGDPPGPPPPPGGGGPGGGGTPVGAPVDGGIGFLLALGLSYGGLKIYQSRKQKETTPGNGTD